MTDTVIETPVIETDTVEAPAVEAPDPMEGLYLHGYSMTKAGEDGVLLTWGGVDLDVLRKAVSAREVEVTLSRPPLQVESSRLDRVKEAIAAAKAELSSTEADAKRLATSYEEALTVGDDVADVEALMKAAADKSETLRNRITALDKARVSAQRDYDDRCDEALREARRALRERSERRLREISEALAPAVKEHFVEAAALMRVIAASRGPN